jgi:hypothetical protein
MQLENIRVRAAIGASLIGLVVLGSSCYGPFNLTRKLHRWNGEQGDKWICELIFLGLNIVPAYTICTIGDAFIFNSVEFWTGENPINDGLINTTEPSTSPDAGSTPRRRVHFEELAPSEGGGSVAVRIEEPTGEVEEFTLTKHADGRVTRDDAAGAVLAGRVLEDGGVVVATQGGEQAFSREDIARALDL